jgi:two-component system, OmpR family, response regulator
MKNMGGLFLGRGNNGRSAAPGRGYRPYAGFPRSLRIVVADDQEDTVLTLKTILEDEGHDVRGITKPKQVLGIVRLFRPDAVILDIAMPELSGYDIAREIRRQYTSERPLLIAITGLYNKASEKALSRAVGFDHHLAKPCQPGEILSLLRPLADPNGAR